jgi:NADH-quinone oxidoreductase subunit E
MKTGVNKAKQAAANSSKSQQANVPNSNAASKTAINNSPAPEPKSNTTPINLNLNVVSALQALQEKYGYLPAEELMNLSRINGIPGVDIYSVATFYNQFKFKKPAKYILAVCRGTACHVKNSETLLEQAKKLLKVEEGESTKDGLITLEVVRCIGACAKAPAVMVNDTVYGDMTEDKLRQLIASLK